MSIEVERKACYDRHEAAIMKNQELIHQLREDNRRLHRKLAGAHAVRWSQHKLKMFEC